MDWSDFEVDSITHKGKDKWWSTYKEPRIYIKTPKILYWDVSFTYHHKILSLFDFKIPFRILLQNFQVELEASW